MVTEAQISETQTATATLNLSRTIAAERSKVYKAWVSPDSMRKWLPPGTMTVKEIDVDFREGGHYFVTMQGTMGAHNGAEPLTADMPIVSVEGTYLEIVPERLVRMGWAGS